MRRAMLAVLAALLWHGAAQGAVPATSCAAPTTDFVQQAERLFRATLDAGLGQAPVRDAARPAQPVNQPPAPSGAQATEAPRGPEPLQLAARIAQRVGTGSATGFSVEVTVERPQSGPVGSMTDAAADALKAWESLRFVGAARTVAILPMGWNATERRAIPEGHRYAALHVEMMARTANEIRLRVSMPERTADRLLAGEEWNVLVIGCSGPSIVVFGVVRVSLHSWGAAVVITAAFGIGFWLFLTYWAIRRHGTRLQEAWQRAHPTAPAMPAPAVPGMPGPVTDPAAPANWASLREHDSVRWRVAWKALRAADPVFISQDGLGEGSLGRLQLLLFSFVVACLVLYVYLRTGVMVGFSDDVLLLLGITGTGTALSRLPLSRRAVSEVSETVLLRLGVVNVNHNMPSFGDVISSRGEVDVTRVQALLFSVIVLVALVANGAADLANFSLPPQLNWLLGISQGVYVAGKLVPSEACTRLDAEMRDLINAAIEKQKPTPPDGADARFDLAKAAVRRTVSEVYGLRAELKAIDDATPAQIAAMPAPPAPQPAAPPPGPEQPAPAPVP